MIPRPTLSAFLIPVSCLVATAAVAQEAPEKALKYHEVLLKRPHNAALFERFFGAWLDEQPVETLDAFLKARAESAGGPHWTVLAIYQLRRGQEDEALAALAKGIEAVPDDPALPMARAKLRLRRLEFEGARADLAKVAAGKDEVLALEAAKLTGKAWLREGKTGEAIKAWDAVLAAHPNDEDLLEDLVETAAAESETAQALVYAAKLIEASRDPYQKTLRMLRRGDLLAQAGKNDEAVEAYASTLNQVGEGSWLEREVLAQIERLFRKQDRLDDLSAQLKKLAEAYPQRLLMHRQLAKLEAALGETDAAIGRFREVLKRSPGDKELREEFVRLLVDGERFDDAVAELEKLIAVAPADAGLYLQVAALRSRQTNPEAVLAALRKAHELLGNDEGNGIRIAGLMLQYGLIEPGESLLKGLAGPAAMEALAAQYGRTGRKAEAVELLKKAGAGDDVEVLLRTTGAISGLGESATAFEILTARAEKFSSESRFLAALAQAALAVGKPADAVPLALKLVRLAKQATELAESIGLASRVIAGAEKTDDVRATLTAQAARTAAETCLLASLLESGGEFIEVGKLLEPDPDPLVIRFHAALLDRRGDFEAAIAVMSRLADTADGRKAAYFKDLSELQQRAGRMIDALATVERWKLAAPGDKSAWITGSRLLRESGKPEEAVKMTRQAVGRFEGDADLAASLAALHDEAGQWPEAEAIYWKLYDEGQSPAEQARWAAPLAQLAQRIGKTGEIEEKLRERARGNRRSIGPILALAELARVANNEDKRLELLLEALRLQPKDLDLRLQVASLEEQSGNPERVIPLLEEALAFDVGERVRTALAQTYLRQGQAVKGLRELRMLSGKAGFDPRSAEIAATSLAGSKLYDEAIGFLRAELPDGGDWRTRYLLAVLLEEDGREHEALPIFLGLLDAQGAIPALVPPVASSRINNTDAYPEPLRPLIRLMAAKQSAYLHRNRRSGYMGQQGTLTGMFSLPNTPEDVRQFALMHLCVLAKKESGGGDESVRKQLKAAGIDNVDFVHDLTATPPGQSPNVAKLLEAYPEQPGLFDLMLMYGGSSGREIDDPLVRRVLERGEKLSPISRFTGWSILATRAKPEDPAWTSMLAAAKAAIGGKTAGPYSQVGSRLMGFLTGQSGECPEIHRPAMKQLLLDDLAATIQAQPESAHNSYALSVFSIAGTPEAWLEELNATIREFRKAPAPAQQAMAARRGLAPIVRHSNNPFGRQTTLFVAPTLENLPIRSIPAAVFSVIAGYDEQSQFSLEELLRRSDQIGSPLMRAWLALKVGNKDAIAKAIAVEPPPEEAADFELLRALAFTDAGQPAAAVASLLKARAAAGGNREQVGAINISLLAVAATMTPEERVTLADELQATIQQCRQFLGKPGAPMLATQARELGLEELAKRIDPGARMAGARGAAATGPAVIAASRRNSQTSSRHSAVSLEKIRKFVTEKKFEAAAREVLLGIRSLDPGDLQEYYSHGLPNVATMLGRDGQAKFLELVDPGTSKSLLKRLEYVEICNALGKPELALNTLEAVVKDRPDDAALAARLAFLLPVEQMDRRVGLMNVACKSAGFATDITTAATRLRERRDNQESLDFFETVTRWLETLDPQATSNVNLTWVSYHAKGFFFGEYTAGLPTLFASEKPANADSVMVGRQIAVCGRLARAMMRHGPCAEEGFRLLASAKVWKIEHAEMDESARMALLSLAGSEAPGKSPRDASAGFFVLARSGGGSLSSGASLMEFSSAAWLVKRMKEVASPGTIFPAEFIAALKERNPAVGEFMAILSRDLEDEDLTVLWNSEVMKARSSRLSQMLRPLMLKQMALTPGAPEFFARRISEIAPGTAVNRYSNNETESVQLLFVAAITGAANGKPGDVDAVAGAIASAVFGEAPDFTTPDKQQAIQPRVNFMGNLCPLLVGEPLAVVRLQSAFHRLGIPLGTSESTASQPFRNKKFDKVDDVEAFLESLGWLTDVARWEPYVSLIYQVETSGEKEISSVQQKLVMDRALNQIQFSGKGDLITRLKERKTGRFGSLMVAAALSSGNVRSASADQAFTEFAAELAKLSQARVDTLSLFLPWLGSDVRARLPEKFQHKQRELDAVKRGEVLAMADEFMASMKTRGGEISINRVQPVVTALIPHDLDRAVAIFVAADEEFTEALGRGGEFSSSSSGDFAIAERDEAFAEIYRNLTENNSPLPMDPTLRLRFLAKLLASPSGKRLAFGSPGDSDRNVFSSTAIPFLKDDRNRSNDGDSMVRMMNAFKALDPGLKPVALPCFVLADLQSDNISASSRHAMLSQIATLVAEDPLAGKMITARLALRSWPACTPDEMAEARKAVTAILSDPAIPDVARLAMAVRFLTQLPKNEFLDPAISTALAKLYQEYCGGERSAVSPVSEGLFMALAKSPVQDDSTSQLHAGLARTFWENASAVKSAGHPPVPNSLAQTVFITALLGKDTASVEKVFPRIKAGLAGKLVPMLSLMQLGRPDLARQLAPLPGEPLLAESHELRYTRALEESLAAFKQAGADKLTLQKLELALLEFPIGSDAEAPAEAMEARVDRLIGDFAAVPTEGLMFQEALHLLLSRSPGNAKLLALLDTWAKANPFSGSLATRNDAAVRLHGIAAIHALALGDSSLFKSINEAIAMPTGNRNSEAIQNLVRMVREMSRTIWFDVCAGTTAGYKPGLPVWMDFVVKYCEQIASHELSEAAGVLTKAHFLACWSGEPEAFTRMLGRLPEKVVSYEKNFPRDQGFATFVGGVREANDFMNMPASASLRVFIEKSLCQPGFADSYSKEPGCLQTLIGLGYGEVIGVIAANPPAGIIPEALPALFLQYGKWMRGKTSVETLALLRKGIETCPAGAAWNSQRGALKLGLVDHLVDLDQMEEGRKVFAGIPPAEVSEPQKERYDSYVEIFAATPKP